MVEAIPKILVIANGNYPKEVTSVSFIEASSGKIPNIAEYDIVIIDLVKVDSFKGEVIMESPQLSKKCIHNLLWAGHELILITDGNYQHIPTGKGGSYYTTILRHLPIQINLTTESGNIVIVKEEPYGEYHKIHVGNQWNYYLIPNQENLNIPDASVKELFAKNEIRNSWFDCKLEKNLAINGFERPISFSVIYEKCDKITRRLINSGQITFLQPPNKTKSVESAIKTLLSNYGIHIETRAPIWVLERKVPGEGEKEKEIKKLKDDSLKIEKTLEIKEIEKKDLTRFKKLLYEKGDELRDIVWDALEDIGFKVNKYDDGKEDGAIENNSKDVVLEIKGHNKSCTTDDVRQLDDWIGDYTSRKGIEPSGLLIVNHYCLQEPSNRGEPFPSDVMRYVKARSTKISLMTTYQLFTIYCDVKNDKLEVKTIKKKIIENEGIFKL